MQHSEWNKGIGLDDGLLLFLTLLLNKILGVY